jgi:hypothetical protein
MPVEAVTSLAASIMPSARSRPRNEACGSFSASRTISSPGKRKDCSTLRKQVVDQR